MPVDKIVDIVETELLPGERVETEFMKPLIVSGAEPFIVMEDIGPERARQLLLANMHNRKFIQNSVETFLKDMMTDQWKYTADTIKIDKNGILQDGQHRLAAVIRSGKTFRFAVAYNLEPDAFVYIDTGRTRQGKDIISMFGEPNYTALSSALRYRYLYDNNLFLARRWTGGRVTNHTILETYNKYPEMAYSVKAIYRTKAVKRLASPAMFSFCHHLFKQISEKDADLFWMQLETGAGLTVDSPVLKLRDKLLRNRSERFFKMDTTFAGAITIKAWNLMRKGITRRILTFQQGRVNPEDFPRAI